MRPIENCPTNKQTLEEEYKNLTQYMKNKYGDIVEFLENATGIQNLNFTKVALLYNVEREVTF